MQGNPKGFHYM